MPWINKRWVKNLPSCTESASTPSAPWRYFSPPSLREPRQRLPFCVPECHSNLPQQRYLCGRTAGGIHLPDRIEWTWRYQLSLKYLALILPSSSMCSAVTRFLMDSLCGGRPIQEITRSASIFSSSTSTLCFKILFFSKLSRFVTFPILSCHY